MQDKKEVFSVFILFRKHNAPKRNSQPNNKLSLFEFNQLSLPAPQAPADNRGPRNLKSWPQQCQLSVICAERVRAYICCVTICPTFFSLQFGINFFHYIHKSKTLFSGIGIIMMHIMEQLPGVPLDDFQNPQQPFIPFRINIQRRGSAFR